jgi:prepilin-type N-terminal cleavage/methylation domain-containing protein
VIFLDIFKRKRKGFTLIELLVVVAISAMMFGVIISYGGVGEEQVLINTETARVIQNVLRSRSLAVTAYLQSGLKICGHGIWIIDEDRFALVRFLRKEDDGSGSLGPPCKDIGLPGQNLINNYDYDIPAALLTLDKLAPGVTFDVPAGAASFILFRPPDPDIFFYGQDGVIFDRTQESSFYLNGRKGSRMVITIGQGGQVNYGVVQ